MEAFTIVIEHLHHLVSFSLVQNDPAFRNLNPKDLLLELSGLIGAT